MANKDSVLVRIDEETKAVMEDIRNSITDSISTLSSGSCSGNASLGGSQDLSGVEKRLRKIEDKIDDISDSLDDIIRLIKKSGVVNSDTDTQKYTESQRTSSKEEKNEKKYSSNDTKSTKTLPKKEKSVEKPIAKRHRK